MKKIILLFAILLLGCQNTTQQLPIFNLGQTSTGNQVVIIYGLNTSMSVYKSEAQRICRSNYRIIDGADGKSNSVIIECFRGVRL